jgi:drug/metabolite transporter (DMT)-like permease
MLRRLLPAAGLATALLLGGCQNPDGSTNWGNTLLLGAGIGTAALGLLVSGPPAAADRGYFIMLLICGAGMLLVTLAAWRAPHGSSPESNIPSPA